MASSIVDNAKVLYSNWFKKIQGDTHQERLQSFYEVQADAYDAFRANFLHGRQPMLAAVAARIQGDRDLVWVDMGGGTGYNVEAMAEIMGGLDAFRAVYIVDLCKALCDQARLRVQKQGWTNVHVIEGDACTVELPAEEKADVVTFSYSLSMIPVFHGAIDRSIQLAKSTAIFGVADFYVSEKYDQPARQNATITRIFWRSVFDFDGIYIGPERRAYLGHVLEQEYEMNSAGHIPFVPIIKAPYYVWVGRMKGAAPHRIHSRASTPKPYGFPSTFIYSMTWEDPREDAKVFPMQPDDVVLSLTSGGCNLLDMLLDGPRKVVGVDLNPCQNHLVELKRAAIKHLDYEDVWKMFGEGKHENIREVYRLQLQPFLPQDTHEFWSTRLYYFDTCLYHYGGMGWIIYTITRFGPYLGMQGDIDALLACSTTHEQEAIYNNRLRHKIFALLRLMDNRFCLWLFNGVPKAQLDMILAEGTLSQYVERVFDQTIKNSLIGKDNYFYRVCMTGRYSRECCPRYLQKTHFLRLKNERLVDRLELRTDTFQNVLRSGYFSKVVLMDHMDWLDEPAVKTFSEFLGKHVLRNGVMIWRSASPAPWYAKIIEGAGFSIRRIATNASYMDRVNMYASFYVAEQLHGTVESSKIDAGYSST